MICLTILFRNIEYVGATVIRPWTLVIVIFFILLVYLVNWSSKKVDKFLKGDDNNE